MPNAEVEPDVIAVAGGETSFASEWTLEYDFRITWDRLTPGGAHAGIVEIRVLGLRVHHGSSYSAAVRLAEDAVADHHARESLRVRGHFIADVSSIA